MLQKGCKIVIRFVYLYLDSQLDNHIHIWPHIYLQKSLKFLHHHH